MPPRWVDDDGQVSRTIPCRECGKPMPLKRHRASKYAPPLEARGWIEWCGHRLDVILVPEGPGWLREVPVLGVAR